MADVEDRGADIVRRIVRSIGHAMFALFVLGGCSTQHVAKTFAKDFGCPSKAVTVAQLNRERYKASGCEKTAVYICSSGECRAEK